MRFGCVVCRDWIKFGLPFFFYTYLYYNIVQYIIRTEPLNSVMYLNIVRNSDSIIRMTMQEVSIVQQADVKAVAGHC